MEDWARVQIIGHKSAAYYNLYPCPVLHLLPHSNLYPCPVLHLLPPYNLYPYPILHLLPTSTLLSKVEFAETKLHEAWLRVPTELL